MNDRWLVVFVPQIAANVAKAGEMGCGRVCRAVHPLS